MQKQSPYSLIHHCTLLMLDYEKVNQNIFDIES